MSSGKDFLSKNREQAKDFDMYKKPMICDQLDEESKGRLDRLMNDIDEHLEEIQKEKEEYNKELISDTKSVVSRFRPIDNAYNYSKENVDRIEQINQSL